MDLRRVNPKGLVAALSVAALATLLLASCGDDDDVSAEEAFCNAGDQLETDVKALASLDVVAEGTDGLAEQFDAVEADLTELKDAGLDVASDEIDALDQSVDDLGTTIDDLGDEITVDNAAAVISAIGDIGSSATAVYTAVAEAC